jgi:hypothetical protein
MEWQMLRRRLRFHRALTGLFLLKYAYLSALNDPEPSLNFFLFQTYNEGFMALERSEMFGRAGSRITTMPAYREGSKRRGFPKSRSRVTNTSL